MASEILSAFLVELNILLCRRGKFPMWLFDGWALAEETLECKQTDRWVGTIFSDRYQILSPVGEGGMGLVYKARHTLMNRVVAIKIIRAELLTNRTLLTRFQQEAMAVSKLNHPNIVTIFDYGVTPQEGTPFLVMDYLDGVSLAQHIIEEQQLLPQQAVELFLQAAKALEHAHEKGIVHRDLKASNLVICKENGHQLTVKVVDFGMAKLMRPDEDSTEFQELTQTGDVFGSPLYMSPEQCRGQKLDERSDIYSFGCVMYYALCGKPPLQGDNVLDTLQRQIHDQPASLLSAHQEITPALNEVVLKALRKKPEDRYQSFSEMIADLHAVASGGSRAIITYQRIPCISAASVSSDAKTPVSLPALPPPRSSSRVFRLFGHNFELTLTFVVFLTIAIAVTAFVSGRMFEEADTSQEESLWAEYNQAGDENRAAGKFTEAENSYMMAIVEAMKAGGRNPRLAKSYHWLGVTCNQDNQYSRAETSLKKAIEIYEKCYGPDCPELSGVLVTLAQTYEHMGRPKEAKELRARAMDLLENATTIAAHRRKSNKSK